MNLEQIKNALIEKYQQPCRDGAQRHIYFWYDQEGTYKERIDELELNGVKLWKLTETNKFITKYNLEVLDPSAHYLVYSAVEKPDNQYNWLWDTLLYSRTFIADNITLIMEDLCVEDGGLRAHFKKHLKFFRKKESYARFASYHLENFTEETINIAVIAVMAKQKSPDFEDAVRAILMESLLEKENSIWQNISKFGNVEAFWALIEKTYGYTATEKSLKGLLIFFMVTSLSTNIERSLPSEWQGHISTRKANCVVFLDHFMHHSMDAKIYVKLADEIEEILHMRDYLEEWEINDYAQVDLFRAVDRSILRKIINSLLVGSEEFTQYLEIISLRKTTHFYSEFENFYEALAWAIEMYAFKKKYTLGIPERDAKAFFEAYAKEYFIMDQAYRKFCVYFDKERENDVLKSLSNELENLYTNWFLGEIAVKWSGAVTDELGLQWTSRDIPQQMNFYQNVIQKALYDNKKSFVIISDALRYEAAQELMQRLNTEINGSTELTWMQGCVPSYTRLGMASLLPHKEISMQGEDIYINGMNTKDTPHRRQILQSREQDSEVVLLKELMEMDRPTLRETFKGKNVVYIYHNVIDKTGDKGDETKTFQAVEQAFDEIQAAISNINKNLTEANIYITSDHGFIYSRKSLDECDKTAKGDIQPFITNKRFLIFDKEAEIPGTINISLRYILGAESNLTVSVPKGDNRFKTQGGGQNYVHGGASLQEIVIPLIKYKNSRKKDSRLMVTKVDVRLTSITRTITNSIFSLDFFQTEKVADKKVAISLKAYFIDEAGQKISNEQSILADKTSDKPNERVFKLTFNLKNSNYSKKEKYYLVLEDIEEAVKKIYEKSPFNISLGIINDFDF